MLQTRCSSRTESLTNFEKFKMILQNINVIQQLLLISNMLKNVLSTFQNTKQIMKKKLFF